MKKYDQIYINGDSYSARREHLVYGDFIQQSLNCSVINRAVGGSNNYRIMRDTIETLLSIRQNSPGDSVLAIVGMSFVGRDEIWYEGSDHRILNNIPDLDNCPNSKLITADFLMEQSNWSLVKDVIVDLNINRQLTHFYTNLFMFTNTLTNNKIDYLIFSAADNTDWRNVNWTYIKSLNVFQQCQNDHRIIDLHKFNIPQFARDCGVKTTETGHMFEDGHAEFSKFLLNKLNEL